jgi:hypothetical protein
MTGNAPGVARVQHIEELEAPRVDATAFRQGWRIRTRLDRLLVDGRISAGTWQAAVEYRSAWERVLAQGGWGEAGGVRVGGGVSDPHQRTVSLLATLTRLRLVEEAIGRLAADLCRCCVVHDHSWALLARHCHRNPETVRDWTALALQGLATAWGGSQEAHRAARRVDPLQGPGNVW